MRKLLRVADEHIFGFLRGQYIGALDQALLGCNTLLDVGCGSSSPVRLLKRRPERITGLDAFAPSVEKSKALGIHDDYMVAPIAKLGVAFPPKHFDAVVALDVLEHLRKPEGLKLLTDMERLARKRVVVFTTNGFVPQPAHSGNPFQEHVSGWSVEEFQALGFVTFGINGWKPLRGPMALPKLWPGPFWSRVSLLTQPFVVRRPSQAFQLLAVKTLP